VKRSTPTLWRDRFAAPISAEDIRRIKQLEAENARLRRALSEFEDRDVVLFPEFWRRG